LEVKRWPVTHCASFTFSIRPSSACNFRTTGALSEELQARTNCVYNYWHYKYWQMYAAHKLAKSG